MDVIIHVYSLLTKIAELTSGENEESGNDEHYSHVN